MNWHRLFSFTLIILFFSSLFIFAQQNADIDAVKKRAEINSLKADLEEVRKKRDMAVAHRWKDREVANQERELFNEKYQENKEKVDALMTERARLFEDVRIAREDLSQVKLQAEKARADFLSLASLPERLETLAKFQEQGVPFKVTERVEIQNKVKKEMSLYRDDPLRIAKGVLSVAKEELEFSRESKIEKADLMFGNSVAKGDRMRLGGIFAMQMASASDINGLHPSAIMLPIAGEKKRVYSWQENLTPETKSNIAKVFANVNDSQFVMVPVDVLLSTELSSELANHTETTWKDDFKQFFKDGGILMYPIASLFVIGMLIFIIKFIWLMIVSFGGFSMRKLKKAIEIKDIENAKILSNKVYGKLGLVLRTLVCKDYSSRANAESALEELFSRETPKIESGLTWVSVFASTAPLLGLLGTVMGMIELFDVITMHGTSDPKLLAGGISIALVTTEAGLIVAIPLQLLHTFLMNRSDALRGRMEKLSLALLNSFWIKEK